MKIRSLAALAIATFSILTASSGAYAAEPAAKAKFVLEKGVDGDNILKYYGRPTEINPLENPDKDIKAERWIYRRKVNETTTQVPVGYTTITPPNVTMDNNGTTNNAYIPTTTIPIYKLRRTMTYQVTALLMVNNKLVLAKQWAAKEEAFD